MDQDLSPCRPLKIIKGDKLVDHNLADRVKKALQESEKALDVLELITLVKLSAPQGVLS